MFVVIVAVVLGIGTYYKNAQSQAYKNKQYSEIAASLADRLQILIEEKRNATLTIGLSIAQNSLFKDAIKNKHNLHGTLFTFSQKLRAETDFKNVWIQLIDAKGIVISRSWNSESGDDLKKFRSDVVNMTNNPKVSSSISVGKYDLSIKAMVPFFDDSNHYIGYLETITHFNSVAKKIQEEGFEPIILVDKSYTNQIMHPFTKTFLQEYYVANKDADSELIEYIFHRGIKKCIEYTTNYTVDEKGKYFIVHYTLYAEDKKPMAYVLMFKEMQKISTEPIKNMSFIINIFMSIIIIFAGLALIFLADKENRYFEQNKNTLKYIMIFFTIFVGASLLYYLFISYYKNNEQEKFLKSYNSNIEKDYFIINKKFQTVANTMFETVINNKEVTQILRQAYTENKNLAREELFELLKTRYEYMKKYGMRQLHFHLKNNESFLRFHRPEKYGDNLTGIRSTVEWVNEHHMRIEGFEEGRIYNGFRYVFPLSYINEKQEKKYIGSIELSFSAYAIAEEFAYSHNTKAGFMVSKNVVNTKVFNEEHSNYEESQFSDFYYEREIKKELESSFKYFEIEKLSSQERQKINRKIFEGNAFSVPSKDANTLFTFLPLKNPVSKKVVAAIILQVDNRTLEQQREFFILLFSIGEILILLVLMFMYREFTQKIKFFDLSLKAQSILDMQESIVIITDGKELFDANKKFLEFFAYDTLNEFKAEHDCVCDFFIENENYYHLKKVPSTTDWVNYLINIPPKGRVVLMQDQYRESHSFAMTYSQYKQQYFIITFTDISETMQEQFMLEKKVSLDKLTGAYNREFFDKQTQKIIMDTQEEGKFLGIIYFDIDHFKDVNDTYGHNVGDYVLQELVKRVTESIRSDDYLIRWGGEEFLVLVATKSLKETYKTAEHLRSMIENHYFEHVKKVTCSFGVTLHNNNEAIAETLARADKALYTSKEKGRNLVTKI